MTAMSALDSPSRSYDPTHEMLSANAPVGTAFVDMFATVGVGDDTMKRVCVCRAIWWWSTAADVCWCFCECRKVLPSRARYK